MESEALASPETAASIQHGHQKTQLLVQTKESWVQEQTGLGAKINRTLTSLPFGILVTPPISMSEENKIPKLCSLQGKRNVSFFIIIKKIL